MGLVLIVAEKPSQAKAYAEAFSIAKKEKTHIVLQSCSTFPTGAVVTWGIGHLVSLKMPGEYKEAWGKWNLANLPIIPDRFEFKVAKDKQQQFNAVKKLMHEANVIINACDVDREGSNIFYSILHMAGANDKTIKRLWINSLEPDEIRKGFHNLRDNKQDLLLYEEAKTRQLSDWLVGINASQLYTLLLQQQGLNTTLSVGRVQSPTVYMIYQRQQEIANFVSRPFYELVGAFETQQGIYQGKAACKEEHKAHVEELLQQHSIKEGVPGKATIKEVTKALKHTKSPRLHSLSTLQTRLNKVYKYSPAKVLEVMQSLYEKKLVTYPRTDCNYITESEFAYLAKGVAQYQALLKVSFTPHSVPNKRYVDNKKVQEHYAIVPTKSMPTPEKLAQLSIEEKHVYDEVLRVTLAMFHEDYTYEETVIVTDVNGLDFHTKGKVEVIKGWQSLFSDDEQAQKEQDMLPAVQENQVIDAVLAIKEGKTTPPKPYTEGGLITMMKTAGKLVEDEADSEMLKEVEGIGTEATRSGIIETIKKNDYIEVKKNIVTVTDKGKILCEAIAGTLLSSPVMTAKWEGYLKKIGEGTGSQENFLKNIEKFLAVTIQEAPTKMPSQSIEQAVKVQQDAEYVGNCPVCQDGKIAERKTFYGCSNYRSGCTFTLPKKWCEKAITVTQIKKLLAQGKTDKIKGFKSKKGSTFTATLTIADGKLKAQF